MRRSLMPGAGRAAHPVGVDLVESVAVLVQSVADGVGTSPKGVVEHRHVLFDERALVALEPGPHLLDDFRQVGSEIIHRVSSRALATAASRSSEPGAPMSESPDRAAFHPAARDG